MREQLSIQVIDGAGPEPVQVLGQHDDAREAGIPVCAPDHHCAAHGSGPFVCCRCGTLFARSTP